MKSYLAQVEEFHRVFLYRQPTPQSPSFDHDTNQLRVTLIREELRELQSAIADNDRVEILDALCDIQYVLSGAVLSWGLRSLFENIKIVCEPRQIPDMERHIVTMFALLPQLEVAADLEFGGQVLTHLQLLQSKLSRLVFHYGFENFSLAFAEVHRSNLSKLWDTPDYKAEGVYQMDATEGGKWIGRRGDGKILKSPSYSPASLAQFV